MNFTIIILDTINTWAIYLIDYAIVLKPHISVYLHYNILWFNLFSARKCFANDNLQYIACGGMFV